MNASRESIKEGYSQYPDHILESVVRYNTLNTAGKPSQHPVIAEKRLVAEVAREILEERKSATTREL